MLQVDSLPTEVSGKERVGQIERVTFIHSHVKHIASGRRRGQDELRDQHRHTHSPMCKTDSSWEAAVEHRGSAQCSVMT